MAKSELLAGAGLASLVAALAFAPGAFAASETPAIDGPGSLEAVVVTAQKREERLQDVPVSISVVTGPALDRNGEQGVADLLKTIPGVFTTQTAFGGATQVSVRGVAAAQPLYFGSSPVAFYLDTLPFGFVQSAVQPDASAYDLERLEVLRGPQGTLYGASAQNGVVRLLTKDADPSGFAAKARTSLSHTEYGGIGARFDGAVNVPLIQDKLAIRGVVGYEHLAGWIDRIGAKDANDGNVLNLRFKINAKPTDRLSIGLSVWHSKTDYQNLTTAIDKKSIDRPSDEPMVTKFTTLGAKIGYEFPTFTVSSNTSYLKYDNVFTVELLGFLDTLNRSETFAQEVYLNSTGEGNWRWTAGAAYRNTKDRLFQTFRPFLPPADFDQGGHSQSGAVFGQLTRLLFDRKLEVTGGLRYFRDRVREYENVAYTDVPNSPLISNSETFSKVSPKLSATWRPNADFTAYLSYSQGFRSGFIQTPDVLRTTPGIPSAKADNLINYEVGAKGKLGRRVTFDASVYYMDWRDVQTNITIELAPGLYGAAVLNGTSASGLGVDAAVTVEPIDRWLLGANISWNDLKEDEAIIAKSGAAPQGIVVFAKGSRLNFSPEATIGLTSDYSFPVGEGYTVRLSASANYIANQFLRRFRGSFTQVTTVRQSIVAGLSATLDAPGGWTGTLFVRNVGDNDGNTWFDVGGASRVAYTRPRTFGVQLEYHY